uniref:Centrosomal protein of 162 kDa n=1 Tax=Timema genevievae TaxID=629358 RepID=A0A7R9K0Y3_TIMGE|nr:unnamed protein product [Timema genevievae]
MESGIPVLLSTLGPAFIITPGLLLFQSNVSDKTVLSEGEREALETSLHDNLTDDDLGNIMEQLSQIADDSSDKSVEEILKEAEELAKENAQNFKELSSSFRKPENVSKTKELIYQLIDKEVHSEYEAVLKESGLLTREREHSAQDSICPTDVSEQKSNESKHILDDYAQALKDSIKPNIETKKPLSIVSEESSVDLSSNGYYGPEDKQQSNVDSGNILNSQLNNLRKELLEERGKILVLKEEMESKEKHHLDKMNQLTQKYEKELFELKKDTLILSAKVTDYENQLSLKDKNGDGAMSKMFGADHRSALLEKELQQQEQLIQGCQRENIKLCQDIKHLKALKRPGGQKSPHGMSRSGFLQHQV